MFFLRKKTFKFDVKLEVEELSSVPFVSGVLFAKIRLVNGGGGTKPVWTSKSEVINHVVKWNTTMRFIAKMSASSLTGILEQCVCRVSIRKELKGGSSFQKLGFVDVNLSEFAGSGLTSRRYLLEGYDAKRRLDNSTLHVNVNLTLLSGDPCFKVPDHYTYTSFLDESLSDSKLHSGNKGAASDVVDYNSDSLTSRSSGFSSLTRKEETSADTSSLRPTEMDRELAAIVLKSKPSDAVSRPIKRSQSYSERSSNLLHRALSTNDGNSSRLFNSLLLQRHSRQDNSRNGFVSTNADAVVEELINGTDFDNNLEASIQLFVKNDGTAFIGSSSSDRAAKPRLKSEKSRDKD